MTVRRKPKVPVLGRNPQKKGVCVRIMMFSPKKPNSANRRVAKVCLLTKRTLIAHIPGEGHNLQQYSVVLVRGGRVRDLPGVKCRLVRNKYDLQPVAKRVTSRSKYGRKNWKAHI
ncbi:MAG: 30S ribosomal protein S12 [Chloroflexi bacterium]|nr:MAG: 30S ribosomal protein S12 [Chloroflexota bacterium]